jgi:hypothetical protein
MASSKLGIVAIATVFGLFIGMGVKQTLNQRVIEAEKIVLKGQNGTMIELSCESDPVIKMVNSAGHTASEITLSDTGEGVISLNDPVGRNRIQVQGGSSPAVYMKNESGEIVGAFLMLQDGGSAIGLADRDGDVAALIRGGGSPSLSLFQKSSEPNIALGINQNTPHLLVTSKTSKDSLVVHGGETTSLLFVDDKGDVSVFLSKHGLYQGKQQEGGSETKKPNESKVFTWQDLETPLEDFKLSPR